MSPGNTVTGLAAELPSSFLMRLGERLLRRVEESQARDEVEQKTWWGNPTVEVKPLRKQLVLNLSKPKSPAMNLSLPPLQRIGALVCKMGTEVAITNGHNGRVQLKPRQNESQHTIEHSMGR